MHVGLTFDSYYNPESSPRKYRTALSPTPTFDPKTPLPSIIVQMMYDTRRDEVFLTIATAHEETGQSEAGTSTATTTSDPARGLVVAPRHLAVSRHIFVRREIHNRGYPQAH